MLYDKNKPADSSIGTYNEDTALTGIYFDNGYELMDYFIRGK
jgi:hypothetical protein